MCGRPRAVTRGKADDNFAQRLLFGFVGLAAVTVLGLFVYSNFLLQSSSAYKEGLSRAAASIEVQQAIGGDIHAQFPELGLFVPYPGSDFAEWSVILHGAHGNGHLYGIANCVQGVWSFSRLILRSDDRKSNVDLTPVRKLDLPVVPEQTVYLVPMGLEPLQVPGWAPDYYRQKMEINVRILPTIPLQPALIDPDRDQLNADRAIAFLRNQHPDLSDDPSAILIGLTSMDMRPTSRDWGEYVTNWRTNGRFAMLSVARLHPPPPLGKLNPEWMTSRLQKLLTKNIAILYFGLPMSSDYSSMLSGGVLSGWGVDRAGENIIGSNGKWDPFADSGEPAITIYDVPPSRPVWRWGYDDSAPADTRSQIFSASLGIGLFTQRKTDFVFPDEPSLQFSRVYRNQDDRSRAFGVGNSDTLDIFLGGKMGVAVDLIMADSSKVQFVHVTPVPGQKGEIYRFVSGGDGRFTEAVILGNLWTINTTDGWTYFFPYTPKALPQYVTVLTGFIDPSHRKYEMKRDSFGCLMSVSSPSGKWLKFENDAGHRIRRITSSTGRSVQYDYDPNGHLTRVTSSDGYTDSYSYDEKGQMLTAAHQREYPVLTNQYFVDGYIKSQTIIGKDSFQYHYFRNGNQIVENQITDPNGLETYVRYVQGGYLRWPPAALGH